MWREYDPGYDFKMLAVDSAQLDYNISAAAAAAGSMTKKVLKTNNGSERQEFKIEAEPKKHTVQLMKNASK